MSEDFYWVSLVLRQMCAGCILCFVAPVPDPNAIQEKIQIKIKKMCICKEAAAGRMLDPEKKEDKNADE